MDVGLDWMDRTGRPSNRFYTDILHVRSKMSPVAEETFPEREKHSFSPEKFCNARIRSSFSYEARSFDTLTSVRCPAPVSPAWVFQWKNSRMHLASSYSTTAWLEWFTDDDHRKLCSVYNRDDNSVHLQQSIDKLLLVLSCWSLLFWWTFSA